MNTLFTQLYTAEGSPSTSTRELETKDPARPEAEKAIAANIVVSHPSESELDQWCRETFGTLPRNTDGSVDYPKLRFEVARRYGNNHPYTRELCKRSK